jgi:hypothetical protein
VLLTTRHSAIGARTRAINHLKALVVNAPERLREQLRALATDQLLARCARLRSHPTQPIEHRARSSGCAAPPSARSPSKPRPTISKPSSTAWSTGSRRGCWPSRAWG